MSNRRSRGGSGPGPRPGRSRDPPIQVLYSLRVSPQTPSLLLFPSSYSESTQDGRETTRKRSHPSRGPPQGVPEPPPDLRRCSFILKVKSHENRTTGIRISVFTSSPSTYPSPGMSMSKFRVKEVNYQRTGDLSIRMIKSKEYTFYSYQCRRVGISLVQVHLVTPRDLREDNLPSSPTFNPKERRDDGRVTFYVEIPPLTSPKNQQGVEVCGIEVSWYKIN